LEFVKLRSNLDCAFKLVFLVLRDSILEYYESESAYLTKEEGGMKGSISIKNGVKITPASPSGDGKSAEGYHFTVENTSIDPCLPSPSHHRTKVLECACLDAESRDSWLQKLRESYHHGVVEGRRVLIAIYVKPEEEPRPPEEVLWLVNKFLSFSSSLQSVTITPTLIQRIAVNVSFCVSFWISFSSTFGSAF